MSQILVLCYHAVSAEWPAALSVTPRALRGQLAWLLDRGWIGARYTEALIAPPAARTLVVTFDDAYRSVETRAAPLLAELGIPGTVFVPTDWPGRRMAWPGIDQWVATPHEGELQAMSWASLRGLAADGWEVGAHSCSHPRLTTLGDAALKREIEHSRRACEDHLGLACESFAYPFGDADGRVREAVGAAGFVTAAGLSPLAFGREDRLEWPRVGVWHGEPDWRFRAKVLGITNRLRGYKATATRFIRADRT